MTEAFTNTASVTTISQDPNPADNEVDEPTSVNDPLADVSVVKTDDPDPVAIGSLLTYTLTVHNAGPSNAEDVLVTDVLPAEVVLVSAIPAPTPGSDPLEWLLGPLAVDEIQEIVVVVEVGPAAYQTLSNVASVAATTADPTLANNQDTEQTTVLNPIADLAVTKTGSPNIVLAGERLTYTLTIYHAGPAYAHDVVVTDTLPAEAIFVSSDPPPATGPNPLTWNLGIIPVEETRVITVLVDAASSALGTFTNTVVVNATSTDPAPGNNQAQAVTQVTTLADVSISKADDPDPVVPGELLNYTLTIVNDGPSDAQNVVVTDTLPAEVIFVSANPAPTGGPNPLTWNLGTVAAGASPDILIVVQVPSWLTSTQSLANVAGVTTTTPDPDLQNNHAEEHTAVSEPSADLALTKSDSADPVEPGALLTYTLVIENLGPSDAVDVTIADTLPPEVSFVSAVPPQDGGPNPLTWNVGNLAASDSTTVEIVVQVHDWVVTPFTNSAAVTATTADPDPANNSDEELTWPDVEVSLALDKSVEPSVVVPGMPFTYVLRITNTGEVAFDSLVLTDTLPAGFVFDVGSGVPSDPGVVAEPLLVWQNLGPLAPGAALDVAFTATPPPNATGSYTNRATVRGVTVIGQAVAGDEAALLFTMPQVAVRKALTGIEVDSYAPNYVTFTITITNLGPSAIDALALVDSYDPYYLSFASALPAADDATDDGSVGWLNLAGPAPHGFGHALMPGEVFVVETVFMVAHEIVSSTLNLAVVTGGTDVYGNGIPMSADSEEVVGLPTAVELLYFRASRQDDRVVLEWETAWETDNWGFNLYRSATPHLADAEWIHFELGQGHGQFEGKVYTYEDLDAGDQVIYYWLEDVPYERDPILIAGPITPQRAMFRAFLPVVHR